LPPDRACRSERLRRCPGHDAAHHGRARAPNNHHAARERPLADHADDQRYGRLSYIGDAVLPRGSAPTEAQVRRRWFRSLACSRASRGEQAIGAVRVPTVQSAVRGLCSPRVPFSLRIPSPSPYPLVLAAVFTAPLAAQNAPPPVEPEPAKPWRLQDAAGLPSW